MKTSDDEDNQQVPDYKNVETNSLEEEESEVKYKKNGDRIMPPLNKKQRQYAQQKIKDGHLLCDTPTLVAYPYIDPRNWGKSLLEIHQKRLKKIQDNDDEVHQNQEALLNDFKRQDTKGRKKGLGKFLTKMAKSNMATNSDITEADPIMKLGYGLTAYRNIMYAMILVFMGFTLLQVPAFVVYSHSAGYGYLPERLQGNEQYSLGALGYSSVQCAQIPLGIHKIAISCPYGQIGRIFDIGVNDHTNSSTDPLTCMNIEGQNDMCKPNNIHMYQEINRTLGQEAVGFNFDPNDLWTTGSLGNTVPSSCADPANNAFVQYSCVQTPEQQNWKYRKLCLVTFFGLITCGLFQIFLRWLYFKGKINQFEWNVNTITAADYSVEMPILKGSFQKWKEIYNNGEDFKNGISMGMSLKKYLKNSLEEQLTKVIYSLSDDPEVNKEVQNLVQEIKDAEAPAEKLKLSTKLALKSPHAAQFLARGKCVEVADIKFAFRNHELIDMMGARGSLIKKQSWKKLYEKEEKIKEHVQKDADGDLKTPTAAFITFETTTGVSCALKSNSGPDCLKTDDGKLHQILPDQHYGGKLWNFRQAPEPTDVIWENRQYRSWAVNPLKSRNCRQCFAIIFILAVLASSFYLIFWLASKEMWVTRTFPAADCTEIDETYGDQLEEYAVLDFNNIKENKDARSTGCLQCFCVQEFNENGFEPTVDADYGSSRQPICGDFFQMYLLAKITKNAISYFISIFNQVLRMIVIFVVRRIGYKTRTGELKMVTIVTFLCQFFNTAFVLLLVNADLSEQPFPTMGFNSGNNGDFNENFFNIIGNTLISTMIFNAIYPILDFLMYWGMRLFFRILDRGLCSCTCSMEKTYSTSIQGYIGIYSGPIYYMHYKYSTILTTAYVTFMYGFGLPYLFPVAILAMAVLYFVEKTMLYWSYQTPPMYDEKTYNMVIKILKGAPVMYCAFGYWMCSNKQLLSNDYLYPIATITSTETTGHIYTDVFSMEAWTGPAWPLLVMFWFFFINALLGWAVKDVVDIFVNKWKLDFTDLGDNNNKMDIYWSILSKKDADWSLAEERNNRTLNKPVPMMLDESYKFLKHREQEPGKVLMGVHTYDLLANPEYATRFCYIDNSIPEEERDLLIIDDDDDETNDNAQCNKTRVFLNLPYFFQEDHEQFKFMNAHFNANLDLAQEEWDNKNV